MKRRAMSESCLRRTLELCKKTSSLQKDILRVLPRYYATDKLMKLDPLHVREAFKNEVQGRAAEEDVEKAQKLLERQQKLKKEIEKIKKECEEGPETYDKHVAKVHLAYDPKSRDVYCGLEHVHRSGSTTRGWTYQQLEETPKIAKKLVRRGISLQRNLVNTDKLVAGLGFSNKRTLTAVRDWVARNFRRHLERERLWEEAKREFSDREWRRKQWGTTREKLRLKEAEKRRAKWLRAQEELEKRKREEEIEEYAIIPGPPVTIATV